MAENEPTVYPGRLAHLIRDAQYAVDAGDEVFAPGLRHLFGRACRIGQRRDRLADATLKSYERRLDKRLDGLLDLKPVNRLYADVRSVLETARRRNIGALDAIRRTLANEILPLAP